MAVASLSITIAYTASGSATFAVPYYFTSFDDLVVTVDAVSSVKGADWNGTGTKDEGGFYPNGGSIVFVSASIPAGGQVVEITRVTARTQTLTFTDGAPFDTIQVSHALDKLTLITQELAGTGFLGLLPAAPTSGNFTVGQWFIVSPPVEGGPWGYTCTVAGTPGTWNAFGLIST